MCFSPQADLVGGVVIGAIGIDVLRHVDGQRRYMPLAALPLIFAVHQLDEAFVWWGLQGHVSATIGSVATWIYLLIAFVLLPVYVPTAVLVTEPPGRRRRIIGAFVALGVGVSALLFAAMLTGPVTATLADWHVSYGTGIPAAFWVVTAYVAATCGALLFSGNQRLAVFGLVNLVAAAAIAVIAAEGLASLWCAWAAVASAAFAVHLRLERSDRDAALRGRVA
jgi:hypothetical protein